MPPTSTSNPSPAFSVASTDTSSTHPAMPPIDTTNANPQKESPLFGRIPGEIRDRIFDLALTAYYGKLKPFEKNAYHYRPGFRYADRKFDTALLRTCRRIYQEAHLVPFQNYERVEWHARGPSRSDIKNFTQDNFNDLLLTSLHLFTQQFWLEDYSWYNRARNIARRHSLRHLKITIRHSDWWWWESSEPLLLDAKQGGTALPSLYKNVSHGFHPRSWGSQFKFFKWLKTFELELETVEGKRKELDEIVLRAVDWRFPLGDENVLVLNPARTRRTGWHGLKLPTGTHVPSDPKAAKQRLVKDGVDFRVWDGEPEISDDDCLTYYVVSLTYEAQRKSGSD